MDDGNTYEAFMRGLTKYVRSLMMKMLNIDDESFLKGVQVYKIWINKDRVEKNSEQYKSEQIESPELKEDDVEDKQELEYENIILWIEGNIDEGSNQELFKYLIYRICMMEPRLYDDTNATLDEFHFDSEMYRGYLDGNHFSYLRARDILENKQLPNIEIYNLLASEKYEAGDCVAKLLIDVNNSMSTELLNIKFDTQIDFSVKNKRLIRKAIEITKNTELILVVTKNVEGSWVVSGLKKSDETGVRICFEGNESWTLYENTEKIFSYRRGKYIFSELNPIREKLGSGVAKEGTKERKVIKKVSEILIKQKHGTAAIIFEAGLKLGHREINAEIVEVEAKRLCEYNKGIKLKVPIEFDETCLGLSNIDGAIFLDTNGKCHAIGVIVDGEAEIPGDLERGARYNSITNYLHCLRKREGKACNPIGIIVSEDGLVNIIDAKSVE